MGGKTDLAYEKYIKSGKWKCSESPTGAHHWIELRIGKLANKGHFLCIYCHDVRKFPIEWNQVNPLSKKKRKLTSEVSEVYMGQEYE